MLVRQAQLDRLVVPEAAERRVDLAGEHRGDQVEADVGFMDLGGVDAGRFQRRVQLGCLVGDPGRPDALAGEVGDAADVLAGERDDRGQRALDERSDRDELESFVAREQQLGLVGDRERRRVPAASSFSGSEGSAGASSFTSRPTARKSPWAIAE